MSRWLTALSPLVAFALVLAAPDPALAQGAPPAEGAVVEAPPPAPPQGDENEARARFEAGKAAYLAGDYKTAVREFKTAKAIKFSPLLDLNIANAYEQLGKLRAAAKYYRLYLQEMPDAPERATIEAKLPQLDARAPAEPQDPAGEDGAQPGQPQYQGQPPSQPPPPPPQTAKKSSYWWIVFPIVGGALLITLLVVAALAVGSVDTYGTNQNDGALFRF